MLKQLESRCKKFWFIFFGKYHPYIPIHPIFPISWSIVSKQKSQKA